MATSPFELFRRNLKPLMIALTVLAMFAFVVLPALESYLRMNQPGRTTETTVARYKDGAFDIDQIDYFNRNHNLTLRFLSVLAEKTMERGGTPQVPDFAQDPQTGAIQALGINSNVSRQAAVTAKLFAAKAEEMGMELDDAALRSWLDRFVDGKLSSSEINGVLATATENQLGRFHMYEQLRTHLLASAAQQVVSAGLGRGNRLTTPPAEQFELFRRLNQQAVITAYPVLVDDYLDQVAAEPTEEEIKELYEDGKKRYPDEMSSEPAFRRPATRTFEFVTADTQKFIEEEMKSISEEELRAEYEQQLEGGEFRMPQSPGGFTPPSSDPAMPGGGSTPQPGSLVPPTDTPAADQTPGENAADQNDDDPSDADEPADAQPADNAGDEEEMKLDDATPSEEPTEDATPSEESDEDATPPAEETDDEAESTDSEVEPGDEGDPADEPAEENDAAEPDENADLRRSSNPVRLVAFAPQDEADGAPQDETDNASDDEPSDDEPSDGNASDDNTSDDGDSDDGASDDNADEPVETAEQAKTSPAEAPEPSEPADSEEPATDDADEPAAPAEPAAKDADQTPAPTENAEPMQDEDDAEASDDEASQADEEAEPEPPSFEEAREDIARQLASAPAVEKARAATRKVNDAMRRYFTRKAIYDAGSDKTAEPPVRPDLEAMAEELGLDYGKTKPLNQFELQDHPLGNTAARGVEMQSGERFPNLVFGDNVPIESPIQTENMSTRQPYVSWITAKTEESIPELSQVRDEVVAHWRKQQARELAKQAAQELATKANESEQPLSELVPEDRKSLLAEEIGPFPWMLWLGRGRPIEWPMQELDRTGKDFMQQAFFQPIGQYGVAPNAPKTVYYTVKTSERKPETEELYERFLRSGERMPVSFLAGETAGEIHQGYFESFQEEVGLEWTDE